jgi:hypothetical protein
LLLLANGEDFDMRRGIIGLRSGVSLGLCAGLLVLGGLAETASAVSLPFQATLTIGVGNLAVSVTGSGVAAVTTSGGANLTGVSIPAGAASGVATVPQTNTGYLPGLAGLSLAGGNAAGSFARTSSGVLAGSMPLSGLARICNFSACSGAPGALPIPLSVLGVSGGSATAPATGSPLHVTVSGAPWTAGAVVVFPVPTPNPATVQGFLHGPASATSSAAQAGGSFQLVTPITILTDGPSPQIGGYARLSVTFVPEPGSLWLAVPGLLALVAARKRLR